jgi:hypothetical protein
MCALDFCNRSFLHTLFGSLAQFTHELHFGFAIISFVVELLLDSHMNFILALPSSLVLELLLNSHMNSIFAIISCFWPKTSTPKTSEQGFFFGQILTTRQKEKKILEILEIFTISV